ncbi:hypothetical protein C2G38_2245036 [Gigaspora rosea]|uniref:Uncharacterized protein n=1 Tax=Gigaspora rosea TaxID=44941 RepID=A0A397VFB7_9GLOM|nr:hypothetical protein C2G38_2245036 [Gigaspora rosea]
MNVKASEYYKKTANMNGFGGNSSLRHNLEFISQLVWKDKLNILYCIASDLEAIHSFIEICILLDEMVNDDDDDDDNEIKKQFFEANNIKRELKSPIHLNDMSKLQHQPTSASAVTFNIYETNFGIFRLINNVMHQIIWPNKPSYKERSSIKLALRSDFKTRDAGEINFTNFTNSTNSPSISPIHLYSKQYINCHELNEFNSLEIIGLDDLGSTYKAAWRNRGIKVAL